MQDSPQIFLIWHISNVRRNGVLALVMPLALVQGEAWRSARDLLALWYKDIMFVAIAAAGQHEQSFSADTGMGEILVVARKRSTPASKPKKTKVLFVNLKRRPTASAEAIEIAHQICRTFRPKSNVERITIGNQVAGTAFYADLQQGGCAGVVDLELIKVAIALESHNLKLPTLKRPFDLAMTCLGNLGQRGLIHRDINGLNPDGTYRGPFNILPLSVEQPTHPALWSHNADLERQIILTPDSEGEVRSGMKEQADAVWSKASRLHFTLDFRLNSQSLAASITERRSVGGRAWPNFCPQNFKHESVLALWSNTTLGLFLFWWYASRQQSGRAILTISQLPSLLMIDASKLTSEQLANADRLLNKFAKQPLLPANEAYHDNVRIALDEEFFVRVLGLDSTILEPLEVLRNKWCAEPSVHGGKNTRIQ